MLVSYIQMIKVQDNQLLLEPVAPALPLLPVLPGILLVTQGRLAHGAILVLLILLTNHDPHFVVVLWPTSYILLRYQMLI